MSGPTKAAPRDKGAELAPERYRVLSTSYINQSLYHKGEVVQLPKGVKPGDNLELIEDEKPTKK